MESVELSNARYRIIRQRRVVAALALFIGTFGLIGVADKTFWIPLVMLGTLITSILLFVQSLKRTTGRVQISSSGVTIDGANVLHRGEIKEARFVPMVPGVSNHLLRVKGTNGKLLEIDVAGEQQANDALAILGQDASRRVLKLTGVVAHGTRTGNAMWGVFALAIASFGFAIGYQIAPLVALGSALLIAIPIVFTKSDIFVGADGVLIKQRLDARLFRYDDIEVVEPTNRGVAIRLRDKRVIQVPMTGRFTLSPLEKQDQASLIARIKAASQGKPHDADDNANATKNVAWRLERGDKTFTDWVARLTGENAAEDFRHAGLRIEDLLVILEDHTHASLSARVGAAMLLAKHGGDAERERIRVAAEVAASPKLRVALEAIAEPDVRDAKRIEEAIREAEEEVVAPQRAASG